ncbi:peptidoglycan-binding domain-containing protein [Streptomyces echinatus]|uniref:Peptidoglycan binding-like domain-containing protein n=1 Tax=Streptomyces echinatus TaxID=67293 RepID=A0A7W9Q3Q2_9ACTN|nr:peptidoglycan-binding domain-containing protein [Streptomyces echinatus]MBB5932247.1 hypothetical protein [Streptomyces echinatus]
MPTPPDSEEPPDGRVLEPVRVVRHRSFDALAELMREFRPDPVTYEPRGTPAGPRPAPPRPTDADTQELPPVPPPGPATPGPATPGSVTPGLVTPGRADSRLAAPHPADARAADPGRAGTPAAHDRRARQRSADLSAAGVRGLGPGRRAVVAVAVPAAALVGFGCALLLPGRQQAAATAPPTASEAPTRSAPPASGPAAPPPAASADPTGAADPDGLGTLRQGDTGPEVTELQQRLLRIPDVYRDGSADGTYDATLTEAVARFQLWYGISGDETGVYGDDTRRALESRTGSRDDS